MDTTPHNFLGLEDKYSRYDDARFVVLPVPYDSAASWQVGARKGPAGIISASQHMEWFDEELGEDCYKCGIATLDPIEPNIVGPEAMHQDLFKFAKRMVRDGKFLFGLGGDHSISSALVRAVMTKHRKLSVLQIDAHCDLRDSYQNSPYSHACVMRRVLDLGASAVSVGVRGLSREEHRFTKRKRLEAITAYDCHMDDDWVDRALNALGETVYVTVDIDAFDPAYAPGTGTPEPGGLDWYQVTGLLRLVAAEKNVVGADIVEVVPVPGQVVTEFLAARLAYKLMAYVQMR
ncbi:MAG: agmatinase [Phycisphaerales bacterium]|nr:MAG: agmatinase [Phycisphaerales bacterium]